MDPQWKAFSRGHRLSGHLGSHFKDAVWWDISWRSSHWNSAGCFHGQHAVHFCLCSRNHPLHEGSSVRGRSRLRPTSTGFAFTTSASIRPSFHRDVNAAATCIWHRVNLNARSGGSFVRLPGGLHSRKLFFVSGCLGLLWSFPFDCPSERKIES